MIFPCRLRSSRLFRTIVLLQRLQCTFGILTICAVCRCFTFGLFGIRSLALWRFTFGLLCWCCFSFGLLSWCCCSFGLLSWCCSFGLLRLQWIQRIQQPLLGAQQLGLLRLQQPLLGAQLVLNMKSNETSAFLLIPFVLLRH